MPSVVSKVKVARSRSHTESTSLEEFIFKVSNYLNIFPNVSSR